MQTNNTEQVKKPFDDAPRHERLLWVLSGATFLIFFQAYMVAPLIPRLASVFGESVEKIGFIIPAYLIPYGVATLFFGALSVPFLPQPRLSNNWRREVPASYHQNFLHPLRQRR